MDEKELYINFDEYIRQGEPDQKEKAGYWQAAIGLQAVDGLKVSASVSNSSTINCNPPFYYFFCIKFGRFQNNAYLCCQHKPY